MQVLLGKPADEKEVEKRRKAVGPDQTETKTGIHNPRRESPKRKVDAQEESTSSTDNK